MKAFFSGPFWIALAATLWATDSLVRFPTLSHVSTLHIVFAEHAIGVLLVLAWALLKKDKTLFTLKFTQIISLILIGGGASAVATLLFTASFRHINPSVTILLQKIQPISVVFFAWIFLREKPSRSFFTWATVALLSALIVAFPDFRFLNLFSKVDFHSTGVRYALGAALIWAGATVLGKQILQNLSPSTVTAWRYTFGFITLLLMVILSGEPLPLSNEFFISKQSTLSILYLGVVTGFTAMVFYYRGLKNTKAHVATLIELIFPIAALVLNYFVLGQVLNTVQIIASATLLYAVVRIKD